MSDALAPEAAGSDSGGSEPPWQEPRSDLGLLSPPRAWGREAHEKAQKTRPHWAVILDISKDEPTFHAFAQTEIDRTLCGRLIGLTRVGIPTRHARKFAQECKSCFPVKPPQKETLF